MRFIGFPFTRMSTADYAKLMGNVPQPERLNSALAYFQHMAGKFPESEYFPLLEWIELIRSKPTEAGVFVFTHKERTYVMIFPGGPDRENVNYYARQVVDADQGQ